MWTIILMVLAVFLTVWGILSFVANLVTFAQMKYGTCVIFKEIKTMTKSDLKPGMVVECRDGDKLIMLNDKVAYGLDLYMTLGRHNDDLTSKDYKNNDIIKVYKVSNDAHVVLEDLLKGELDSSLSLIWECSKEIVLTMEQIAEKFNVDVNQLEIKK